MQDLAVLHRAGLEAFGLSRDFLPPFMLAADTVTFLAYLLVGVLIFARKSRETLALFASAALITAAVTIVRPTDSLFFVDVILHVPILIVFALGTGSINLFILLFPDGRFAPRWLIWPALLTTGLSFGAFMVQLVTLKGLQWPPPSVASFALPGILLGVASQIYRYFRVSNVAQRQQTKWVVFGLGVGALGLIGYQVARTLVDVTAPTPAGAAFVLIVVPAFYFTLLMLPASMGFSILRFRLWDIDLIIQRTLLYGVMTALMAGVFGAVIIFGQKILLAVTGQESDLAGFFAAVAVVGVFTPMKDYLNRYLDNRSKFGPAAAVRLRGLVAQVNARVSPVDAYQLSRRFAQEAVVAFGAKGGAVYWQQENGRHMIYETGSWDGDARMAAALRADEGAAPIGVLAIGSRINGKDYTEQEHLLLDETAREIAAAIAQDRADLLAQGYLVMEDGHA
jgi:hypothetical protein